MEIDGLTFGYGAGEAHLFDGFRFACDERIVLFCGRSGCGKTTLLKLLSRLLQPKRVNVFSVPASARMILQVDALFPWLTVAQNLAVTSKNGRWPRDDRLHAPIEPLLPRRVYELSFGQRRIVELCRALSNPPALLCLDEPFNFLDPAARQLMAGLITAYTNEGRCQVALTTHHQEDVALFDAPVFHFPEALPLTHLARGA